MVQETGNQQADTYSLWLAEQLAGIPAHTALSPLLHVKQSISACVLPAKELLASLLVERNGEQL